LTPPTPPAAPFRTMLRPSLRGRTTSGERDGRRRALTCATPLLLLYPAEWDIHIYLPNASGTSWRGEFLGGTVAHTLPALPAGGTHRVTSRAAGATRAGSAQCSC
jgi:hypothetical protein